MDQQRDGRNTRIPETSLSRSIEDLAGQLEPYRVAFAAFQSTIAQVAEQWQQVIARIAEIDWAGAIGKLEASHTTLAEAGWTPAEWIGLHDLAMLSDKKPEELDEYFTNGFMANDSRNLDALLGELLKRSSFLQWHELLNEIFASIKSGRYRIAIPATLTIIEGLLANFLIKHSVMKQGNSSPFTALHKQGWHAGHYNAFFWKSGIIFLQKIFEYKSFAEDEPPFVHRHWILHGRSAVNWTLADSLRLVNALTTLDFLFDTIGPKSDLI